MDENAREFVKGVVGSDLEREIIDVLAIDGISFEERLEIILNKMEGGQ